MAQKWLVEPGHLPLRIVGLRELALEKDQRGWGLEEEIRPRPACAGGIEEPQPRLEKQRDVGGKPREEVFPNLPFIGQSLRR